MYTSLNARDASMKSRAFSESSFIGVVCVYIENVAKRLFVTYARCRHDGVIWLLLHKDSCVMNKREQ